MCEPLSIASCAALACLWEATAAKPGNVYRGADFENLSYADFLASAAVVGPALEQAASQGVGAAVRAGAQQTWRIVQQNTNLGILLLLAPLAACRQAISTNAVADVLTALTPDDARYAYEAIRLAQPGGLGEVDRADVRSEPPTDLTLLEAMRLAADRDAIARQYVNNFHDVFRLADAIENYASSAPLGAAIVDGFVWQLSELPDSLIARKCGRDVAEEASDRAAAVAETDTASREQALADFDFWLRSDGHRRNPGTTADLVAAALFVLLRQDRIEWPVRFY